MPKPISNVDTWFNLFCNKFEKKSDKRNYVCPVCGTNSLGIKLARFSGKIILNCLNDNCESNKKENKFDRLNSIIETNNIKLHELFYNYEFKFQYLDANGNLYNTKIRNEVKKFNKDEGACYWEKKNNRECPPYHLPQLLKAINNKELIFIVEGEKKVENLEYFGYTATCSPHGSKSWIDNFTQYFKPDSQVIIIPDNNLAGQNYVKKICDSFFSLDKQAPKIINLPNIKEGEDITNWLDNYGTKEEIENLITHYTVDYVANNDTVDTWNLKDLDDFMEMCLTSEPEPYDYIIPEVLTKGTCGYFYGPGGTFKSLETLILGCQLATSNIYDFKWFDRFPLQKKSYRTLFCSLEDQRQDLHHRIKKVIDAIFNNYSGLCRDDFKNGVKENFKIIPREDWKKFGIQHMIDKDGNYSLLVEKLTELIKVGKFDICFIDTESRASLLDEQLNDGRIVSMIEQIRDDTGAAIIFIAHTNKNSSTKKLETITDFQNALRGGSARISNARWGLAILPTKDIDIFTIGLSKNTRDKIIKPFNVKMEYPLFKLIEDKKEIEKKDEDTEKFRDKLLLLKYIKNNPDSDEAKIYNQIFTYPGSSLHSCFEIIKNHEQAQLLIHKFFELEMIKNKGNKKVFKLFINKGE